MTVGFNGGDSVKIVSSESWNVFAQRRQMDETNILAQNGRTVRARIYHINPLFVGGRFSLDEKPFWRNRTPIDSLQRRLAWRRSFQMCLQSVLRQSSHQIEVSGFWYPKTGNHPPKTTTTAPWQELSWLKLRWVGHGTEVPKKSCGKGNFSLPYEGIMNHHHPLIYGQNHYLRQNFGDCSFEPLLGNSWHLWWK